MRLMTSWLAAGMVTLAITIGMTLLPGWLDDAGRGKPDMTVMRPGLASALTNSNLVDVLSGVTLREKLEHAEWNGNVLSLELSVTPAKGRPQALFSDVEKLTELAFRQLDNVDRLLVRITERADDRRTLLAAVDVRRSDEWLQRELKSLTYADPVHDELWRHRLRLSFTRAWETRFGPVSGFSAKVLPAPAAEAGSEDVAN
ncbi:hypothetical protein RB620_02190 [Paenibacillus sp. LHD-117]|uniref:hypothetical protein n=1 Tax=Paenibacillus sp. LHD-117 TaxID=3071412 RepID=UPI0027E07572|nr:hypothetical protein [Paenibacillus sp. LHD-117]MDQ6418238.1 hypothetical protein [Paenibacillus sp. LHD-117]